MILRQPTATSTPTPTPTATATPTATPTAPPQAVLFCSSLSSPRSIPDNDPTGISNSIAVSEAGVILDVNVYLNIRHSWVGDLFAQLSGPSGGISTLLNRPGYPAADFGCDKDNFIAILDDEAERDAENKCGAIQPAESAPLMPAIGGWYRPTEALSVFRGQPASGEWTLKTADLYQNDTGTLYGWCLEMTIVPSLPAPTPTPTPVSLPSSALIEGVDGANQALPLDCESRSAVDWAASFGTFINEFTFFYGLPVSDDPDAGFVGDVEGTWGQIPPNDYGVHAEPIASRLRTYGLPAAAVQSMSWDELRAEIAAGRPVEAWVIGAVASSYPVFYTASNGHTSVVAPYEHTVIVVGYGPDSVTVLNGAPPYDTYPLARFLDSWGVLRNMAVIWKSP